MLLDFTIDTASRYTKKGKVKTKNKKKKEEEEEEEEDEEVKKNIYIWQRIIIIIKKYR